MFSVALSRVFFITVLPCLPLCCFLRLRLSHLAIVCYGIHCSEAQSHVHDLVDLCLCFLQCPLAFWPAFSRPTMPSIVVFYLLSSSIALTCLTFLFKPFNCMIRNCVPIKIHFFVHPFCISTVIFHCLSPMPLELQRSGGRA